MPKSTMALGAIEVRHEPAPKDSPEDCLYWQEIDKKTVRRIHELIKDTMRSPFGGSALYRDFSTPSMMAPSALAAQWGASFRLSFR